MELVGLVLVCAVVFFNAVSFFRANSIQKEIYKVTVRDTSFNKKS